jgi:hypothetical protein
VELPNNDGPLYDALRDFAPPGNQPCFLETLSCPLVEVQKISKIVSVKTSKTEQLQVPGDRYDQVRAVI